MTEVPNAITPEEFAKHFGWSARRVRELARELGACRIVGNRMVLLQQDVDALLEAARPKPRPKPSSHQFNGPAIPQGSYAALVKSREKGKLDTTQAALDYLAARVKKKPK